MKNSPMKILLVAGARPNFMKIAPLIDAIKKHPSIHPVLVHTGQHYDEKMSGLFFHELGIPEPDVNLEVGSGSHAVQTAEIMTRFEPVLLEQKPDCVLVVGDVNSTIACGLVAVKLGVRLIHVEAGLRSFDRDMPEEINRILTDSISDILFCSEPSGVGNLLKEGVPEEKIHLVGNVMIDTLLRHRDKAEKSLILDDLQLREKKFAVATIHRPANVDDEGTLTRIMSVLHVIGNDAPVVFPIHPRTKQRLASWNIKNDPEKIIFTDPLGYLDFLKLVSSACVVLTDSGGIQEETTILKVPCLTLRENTERPCTVEIGSNQLVGTDPEKILSAYQAVQRGKIKAGNIPPLWDGNAAERIVTVLRNH